MLSAGIIGLICGATIGLFAPLLLSVALYVCGFGCGGVLAAVCCCNCSIAAAVMSAIHPVASGSAYAYLQSCAALFPWSPLIWVVSGGIGAGLGYLIGDTFFATNATTTALFAANATSIIGDFATNFTANGTNMVGDFAANATNIIGDLTEDAWDAFEDFGTNTWNTVSNAVSAAQAPEPTLGILCVGIILSVLIMKQ